MEFSQGEWFAVRCIFDCSTRTPKPGKRATYEERVTLWQVSTIDEAIELAEAEAESYASGVNSRFLGLSQAFRLFDPPVHGAEVFSLMRDSDLTPREYISTMFDTGGERQGN